MPHQPACFIGQVLRLLMLGIALITLWLFVTDALPHPLWILTEKDFAQVVSGAVMHPALSVYAQPPSYESLGTLIVLMLPMYYLTGTLIYLLLYLLAESGARFACSAMEVGILPALALRQRRAQSEQRGCMATAGVPPECGNKR